ncbi:MAG: type II secretion system protein [Clostridia bacterium]
MRNDRGFTLVEVLIAILVLGVICVTVLQLFALSNKLEKQSFDLEMANVQAVKTIELIKAADHPSNVALNQYFDHSETWMENDILTGRMSFDEDWSPLESGSPRESFILTFSAIPEQRIMADGHLYGSLYFIRVWVVRAHGAEFISYEVRKYYGFPSPGGVR